MSTCMFINLIGKQKYNIHKWVAKIILIALKIRVCLDYLLKHLNLKKETILKNIKVFGNF